MQPIIRGLTFPYSEGCEGRTPLVLPPEHGVLMYTCLVELIPYHKPHTVLHHGHGRTTGGARCVAFPPQMHDTLLNLITTVQLCYVREHVSICM